ncbi:MAG: crotonobetainyl-CoA hydratase [Methylobacteriaceae bacterium]|nr:crotonobetainyl-CoA hydratase [Methylobacteriaceae bacterium]
MSEFVRTRTDGAVLEVTLDRPKANAIDLATSRRMGEVFRAFRDDEGLRVAILTGAGERFFSAGWDLKAAAAGEAVDGDYGVGGFGGIQELRDLNKPVIAAVNGLAVGGGFELALSCDLILAADTARFALPENRAGTLADAATVRLPKRIPYHVAMDLLFTGRWMEPDEARRWGLLKDVLPAAQVMAAAWRLARELAAGPPLVFAAIKEVARIAEAQSFQTVMNMVGRRQLASVDRLYASEDNKEGARAFAEKRDPIWRGR